ncbi:MAG: hypothetical protein Q4A27_03080 [bacterium]|nr:hypothetical protein [bacterium]
MAYYSDRDDGGEGCLLVIGVIFILLVLSFHFGASSSKGEIQKEIIVEDSSSLSSYVEAAEKLELDYKIQNSGDKKKIIIYLPE